MGLDLWFQEDVSRILASTQETMIASTNAVAVADDKEQASYQRGFLDAIRTIAVAFGVEMTGTLQVDSKPWRARR